MPRVREWKNESFTVSPGAGVQLVRELATGLTVKGATVVRQLVEMAFSPVTINADVVIYVALWVGPANGEPANIDIADNASFLYWTSMVHHLSTAANPGVTERFLRKTLDLRGQRVFRSDFDGLWLIVRASGASAITGYFGTRTLVLEP